LSKSHFSFLVSIMNKLFTSAIAAAFISAPILGVVSLINPSPSLAQAAGRTINLPFGKGQTWYVCQGYNGTISHGGASAFDLTVENRRGPNGCFGDVNVSAGRQVTAPGAGTVTHVGADLVCLKLDTGGSLLIGHIVRTVPNGGRVAADAVIGKVSRANQTPNGGYAHHAPDQQQFLSLMPTDFGSMECPVYQIPDVQMSMPEQL
jgi:hypothetical protein